MSYLDKYEFMVKEAGFSLLTIFFLFLLFSILTLYSLAIVAAFAFLAVLYFYRNPNFKVNVDSNLIVSPLTGRVVSIYKEDGKNIIEIEKGFNSIGYLRAPSKTNMEETSHMHGNGANLPKFSENAKVFFRDLEMEVEFQGVNFTQSLFLFIKMGVLEKGRIFGFFKMGYAKISLSDKYELEVKNRDFLESGRSVLVKI